MSAVSLRIYPENPEMSKIDDIVRILKHDGVIIYPTDTIYALGCDIFNARALERIRIIKGMREKDLNFAFICSDLSNIAEYAKVDTPTFKIMKNVLPGPYTFILPAMSRVPKIFHAKKKTVGIRVPDNLIPRTIVGRLGNPILTTTLAENDMVENFTDPEMILDKYQNRVDAVIDGGPGGLEPSTIVDFTDEPPTLVREGKGEPSFLL